MHETEIFKFLGTWSLKTTFQIENSYVFKVFIFCERVLNKEWHLKSQMLMILDDKVTSLFMKTEKDT